MIRYDPLFNTMKMRGISGYRLCKMGIPQTTYYSIRRGENITTQTLNQLCKILNCGVSDIIEYVNDNEK